MIVCARATKEEQIRREKEQMEWERKWEIEKRTRRLGELEEGNYEAFKNAALEWDLYVKMMTYLGELDSRLELSEKQEYKSWKNWIDSKLRTKNPMMTHHHLIKNFLEYSKEKTLLSESLQK